MQLTLWQQNDSYSALTTSITSKNYSEQEIQVSKLPNALSLSATVSKAIVTQHN